MQSTFLQNIKKNYRKHNCYKTPLIGKKLKHDLHEVWTCTLKIIFSKNCYYFFVWEGNCIAAYTINKIKKKKNSGRLKELLVSRTLPKPFPDTYCQLDNKLPVRNVHHIFRERYFPLFTYIISVNGVFHSLQNSPWMGYSIHFHNLREWDIRILVFCYLQQQSIFWHSNLHFIFLSQPITILNYSYDSHFNYINTLSSHPYKIINDNLFLSFYDMEFLCFCILQLIDLLFSYLPQSCFRLFFRAFVFVIIQKIQYWIIVFIILFSSAAKMFVIICCRGVRSPGEVLSKVTSDDEENPLDVVWCAKIQNSGNVTEKSKQ